MLLNKFKQAKAAEIALLKDLARCRQLPRPWKGEREDFLHALTHPAPELPLAMIAEFKQASPSRGVIATGLEPTDVAQQYAAAGATCISVLTEERYFGGDIAYLHRMHTPGVPLLRKDFIFDPLQVIETASTPASALLLIVRLTPQAETLRALRQQAEAYGMHAVVEVFDSCDLAIARESGARIIQVNARDLDTLKTDRTLCLEMARLRQDNEVWIAASAMSCREHLQAAAQAGYQAALIGTALMEHGTPGATLKQLLQS